MHLMDLHTGCTKSLAKSLLLRSQDKWAPSPTRNRTQIRTRSRRSSCPALQQGKQTSRINGRRWSERSWEPESQNTWEGQWVYDMERGTWCCRGVCTIQCALHTANRTPCTWLSDQSCLHISEQDIRGMTKHTRQANKARRKAQN